MATFDRVYTIKKEFSKEAFLRDVMVKLASNPDTPIDVVNASFDEVQESVREAILCSAHVETDYTASIGYDRIEEYWDKEKKTEYVNGQRYEHYVDVKKTRTVTDWQPHSGHISGDATRVALNEDNSWADLDDSKLVSAIKGADENNIVEKGEATVNSSGLDRVKSECAWSIHWDIRYPGDHHKDEHYSDDISVSTIECFKLPFYSVQFTYKGKKYSASAFACGPINVTTEFPPDNVNIVEVAEKDTKKYKTASIISWISFGVLFAFSFGMLFAKIAWTWFLPLIALVTSILLHVNSDKKYACRLKELTEDNNKLKKKELEVALGKKGYTALSSEEKEAFSAESASKTANHRNTRKGVKGKAIGFSILTAILIIASLICGSSFKNANLHSPDQVTIQITQKTQEYKSNVSPYVNGCYYVYFTYKVSANEIGIDNMQIRTTVYKNGVEQGTINTSLEYMNLDAGATKTYSTYLQDNQPEANHNTFFIALYNADSSDLTYKFEIRSIHFSDGQYYFSDNYNSFN